jgi:NADPH-dependent ferric siderophore reductase
MRRITLAAPAIEAQHWPLACDIAIVLTSDDGREVRRRYTVRTVAGDALVIDAVLHGHGPGSAWAASVGVADEVTFYGPRGEISVADADWLWAFTDEAGLPAIAALAESVPDRPIQVLAEIADGGETYPLPDNAAVTWLPRGSEPAGHTELLSAALETLNAPDGQGYAYILGESRAVVALREALGRYGLSRADVYAKGYWNLNSRRAR